MTRLTRQLARDLNAAIAPFFATYDRSDVTLPDDLAYWAGGDPIDQSFGGEQLKGSRAAIEAAIPELRRAARRVLDLLGDA